MAAKAIIPLIKLCALPIFQAALRFQFKSNALNTRIYGNSNVLENINLSIQHGELVLIVGQSGAGKSTLLKLIFGEEQLYHGRLLIDGIDISHISKNQIPFLRRKIGVVFQDMKL